MASPMTESEDFLTLRTVCAELKEVAYKWSKIGVQLGIPHYKLKEFKKEDDPLAAAVDYWLCGNVEGVPVSWRSVVAALMSSGETGLAKRISKKYCQHQDNVGGKDSTACAESVSSVTSHDITSSGHSTFVLPDLSPYFPYFPTEPEMPKEDLDCYFCNLDCHTSKIRAAYSAVICKLQKDLEINSTLQSVINCLKAYDKPLCDKLLLTDCKSIEDVFSTILDHFSFFNFEIIKVLTRIGSRNTKNYLKEYRRMFKEYSKRRVVECPSDAFGDDEKSDKDYILKMDRNLQTLTVKELKMLCYEVNKILGHKRLLRVTEGCVQLTFSGFENDKFHITEEQQQALRNVGVLSISYGDQIIDISKKFVRKNVKTHDDKSESDTDNDSGFNSKATKSASGSEQFGTRFDLYIKEKDLIDPRIDMLSSSRQNELLFQSPLYIATDLGNMGFVKKCIEEGANPMDKNESGDTLLQHVAGLGNLKILRYLVDEVGCNPATEGSKGSNALYKAVCANHLHIVKYLVEECKLDPTTLDDFKHTPLNYACYGGSLEMARYLVKSMLEHFCMDDIIYNNHVVNDGKVYTPLGLACNTGNLQIVKYLIEECNCNPSLLEHKHGKLLVKPLLIAVSHNHLHVVKYLCTHVQVQSHSEELSSLVHIAVANNYLEMVKLLIQSLHYNPNTIYNLMTPLHFSTFFGQLSIVKYFVSLGCDPHVKTVDGLQLIHLAAIGSHFNSSGGHTDVIHFLVKEQICDPNSTDKFNMAPVHYAAQLGQLEMTKCLVDELKCDSQTALHTAIQNNQLPVLRYLIEDKKCEPLITDIMFHQCAIKGHLDTLKYLIKHLKMDKNSLNMGFSILSDAAINGHLPVVSYLLEIGSVSLDRLSLTPLHHAANKGHLHIVKYLMTSYRNMYDKNSEISPLQMATMSGHLEIVKYFLVDRDFNQHMIFQDGNTLVCAAATFGRLATVQYLVNDMKCDPFVTNTCQDTPLHCACFGLSMRLHKYFVTELFTDTQQRNLKVVKYLVEDLKCDVNRRNQESTSPLHNTAQRGQIDIARYLIEKKADIVCLDNIGNTPLHLAASLNHFEVVKFLTDRVKKSIFKKNYHRYTPLNMTKIYHHKMTLAAVYLIVTMFNSL